MPWPLRERFRHVDYEVTFSCTAAGRNLPRSPSQLALLLAKPRTHTSTPLRCAPLKKTGVRVVASDVEHSWWKLKAATQQLASTATPLGAAVASSAAAARAGHPCRPCRPAPECAVCAAFCVRETHPLAASRVWPRPPARSSLALQCRPRPPPAHRPAHAPSHPTPRRLPVQPCGGRRRAGPWRRRVARPRAPFFTSQRMNAVHSES